MILAYLNNDIQIGESINGYIFTELKARFNNHILLLSEYKPDFYILKSKRIVLHKSWLKCITEIDDATSVGIVYYRGDNGSTVHRIANIQVSTYTVTAIDIEHSISITPIRDFITGVNIIEENLSIVENIGKSEICPLCNNVYLKLYSDRNIDGVDCCNGCFNNSLIECSRCSRITTKSKERCIVHNGETLRLCEECFSMIDTCVSCGITLIPETGVSIEEETRCYDCFKLSSFTQCEVCGTYFKNNNNIYTSRGKKICKPCWFKNILESNIKEYKYKPLPNFFTTPNDHSLMFYGIELEILTPTNRNTLNKFLEMNVNIPDELVYCKFDRSIGDDGNAGFEIVSHPMTYEYITSNEGVSRINKIMDLKTFGCKAFKTNTCGMHIHMSKNQFTDEQLFNFLSFIYNNKEFCIKMSDRTDLKKVREYCKFEPEYDIHRLSTDRTNGGNRDQRHRAVNLNPEDTVEIRIFRSTLDYSRFMKNIELCKSIYDFVVETNENTLDEYKKFIKTKTYYNLNKFLELKKEI